MKTIAGKLDVSERAGTVSCLTFAPADPLGLLILGHGAGGGMRHTGMESLASALASEGVATFRYHFPYMERGRRFPDPLPTRLATVTAAVEFCSREFVDLPLFAGGRSMGGRMSSTWASQNPGSALRGLVFYGFPLHAAGKPGTSRAAHLQDVEVPMLFLQGTRDKLAGLDLLEPLCADLGERARLHIVRAADHGFHVPKRSGRTSHDVMHELAVETRRFFQESVGPRRV